jgi:AraC-like DNA-binding protein
VVLTINGALQTIPRDFIVNYTTFFQWFVVVSLLSYSIAAKKTLYNHKSESEQAKVRWKLINNIASILATGILLGIFFEITQVIKTPIRDFHLRVLPYACFAFIPVLILRYKIEQKSSVAVRVIYQDIKEVPVPASEELNPVLNAPASKSRYEKSSLDDAAMNKYETMLNRFVEKSKIYLNAELSLEELAVQVKIPKHHLTQVLNDCIKKNFYVYINEYRIQEAVKRLKNIKNDVNILSLAYDCGFNSKSSFNNYFKKLTGYTPSAYRKMAESSEASKDQLPA